MKQIFNSIKNMPLFQTADSATREQMDVKGRIRTLKKGSILYCPEQAERKLFVLMEGYAFLYTMTKEGGRKIIFVFGPGVILNEKILDSEKVNVYCEMLTAGKVYDLDEEILVEMMRVDFELTKIVMRSQEQKLQRTCHQLKNTMGNIFQERKLAAKLWKLGRDFGIPAEEGDGSVLIGFDVSVTFLADMMGTPRETASRICSRLAERGLIRTEKKRITVTDMECLSRFYRNACANPEECMKTGEKLCNSD